MGAMAFWEVENWWETADSLEAAVATERLPIARTMIEGDSLSIIPAEMIYTENEEQWREPNARNLMCMCD